MMNMKPHLLNDTDFEVAVDNDMVEKYMLQLKSQIENYLRENLHNRKINMQVRVSAPNSQSLQPCRTLPDDEPKKSQPAKAERRTRTGTFLRFL